MYVSSIQMCKSEPPKLATNYLKAPSKKLAIGCFQWAAVGHTGRILVHTGRVRYEPRQRPVPLIVRKLAISAKRDTTPDFLFGTHQTVSSGTGQKLREDRKTS